MQMKLYLSVYCCARDGRRRHQECMLWGGSPPGMYLFLVHTRRIEQLKGLRKLTCQGHQNLLRRSRGSNKERG